MKLSILVAPSQPSSSPRSCARCGSTFHSFAKEYTCPDCRNLKHAEPKTANHRLSFRERQIVALVREAKANKEIAYQLCLTEGTVKEYLYHIFRKLNVSSRTELALWAYREALALEPASGSHLPQYDCRDRVNSL